MVRRRTEVTQNLVNCNKSLLMICERIMQGNPNTN